jgi:hypothetical protein
MEITADKSTWPLNARQETALRHIEERFIDERVRGYRGTDQTWHPPIPKEEAQALWKQCATNFRRVMFDPDLVKKLCFTGGGMEVFQDPGIRPDHAWAAGTAQNNQQECATCGRLRAEHNN